MAKIDRTYAMHGFEGDIYIAAAGTTPTPGAAGTIKLEHIREVTYTWGYGESDSQVRKHKGVKTYAKGSLDISINFTLVNMMIPPETQGGAFTRPPDVERVLEALRNRHDPISILMLDKDDGEGPCGDIEIFAGDKAEGDEDLQSWAITARPTVEGRGVGWYPDDFT